MFGTLQLILAAAIAAAAASSSWWLTRDHYLGVIAADKVAAVKLIDTANQKAENAAIDWQAWADVQPAKIVYRNRKVADALKADPVWAATPIPAGVRDQLAASAPGEDPAVADSAVPAPSAASAPDQRGSGTGLSGLARFFGRLRQAPQLAGESPDPQSSSHEVAPP